MTHSLHITVSDRDVGSDPDMVALGITASLDEALRHLRRPTESVILWIDQICIQQSSSAEKNAQVARMDRIYSLATGVLVWLGPSADDSDLLMDVWQEVGAWARDWGMENYFVDEKTIAVYSRIISNDDPTDPATAQFNDICKRAQISFFGNPPGSMRLLNAMVAWYKRAWFSRVWVVQEFSLSSNAVFVCGQKQLDVDLVKYGVQVFDFAVGRSANEGMTVEQRTMVSRYLYLEPTGAFFSCRSRRRKLDMGIGKGDTLSQILGKLYNTNRAPMSATDPRDRIYGLLGLANDSAELDIVADYSPEVTTDLVFAKATRALIKHQSNLDVLGLSQFPKNLPNHKELVDLLPSWVPDWYQPQRSFYWTADAQRRPPMFHASGSPGIVRLIETNDERVLGVGGILVDEIEETGRPWLGDDDPSRVPGDYPYQLHLAYFRDMRKFALKSAAKIPQGQPKSKGGQPLDPIYSTPERREEAVWRTLIGDLVVGADCSTSRATSANAQDFRQLQYRCEFFEVSETGTPSDKRAFLARADKDIAGTPYSKAESQFSLRLQEMRHKRPFVTQKGYLGMAPIAAKPKDVVAVLYGGVAPFILRPQGGGHRYKLLGEAYCDMVMDGQVVEENDCPEEFFLV